jgi:hypothetical protein
LYPFADVYGAGKSIATRTTDKEREDALMKSGKWYHIRLSVTILVAAFCLGFGVSAASDTIPPTVMITSPTSASSYTSYTSTINIGGTAFDNIGVTSVTWINDSGGFGTCDGTNSWSCTGITLYDGLNIITVTAHDAATNASDDVNSVTYKNQDTKTPTVMITSPTVSPSYTSLTSTIKIGGSAIDNIGVTSVTWINDRGGSGTCSGTSSLRRAGKDG